MHVENDRPVGYLKPSLSVLRDVANVPKAWQTHQLTL